MISSGSGETVFLFRLSTQIIMVRTTLNDVNEVLSCSEEFNEEHFANIIHHADSMLNMTLNGISVKYADHLLLVIQCYEKGEMDEHIEVNFKTEGANIACNFDADKKCESTGIFLDQLDEHVLIYKDYVRYLNSKYMHYEGQFCWKMPQGTLSMLVDKGRGYFQYNRGLEVPLPVCGKVPLPVSPT